MMGIKLSIMVSQVSKGINGTTPPLVSNSVLQMRHFQGMIFIFVKSVDATPRAHFLLLDPIWYSFSQCEFRQVSISCKLSRPEIWA